MSKKRDERLTMAQKEANGKKWYKDKANSLDFVSFSSGNFHNFGDKQRRMKINYDLYNGILNKDDFNYVIKPYGKEIGELPASMNNKDIVSGKINTIIGMEQKLPFTWNVYASDEVATTQREQEEFNKIRQYVVEQIMIPIKQQIAQQKMEEVNGKELNPDQISQINAEIEQEVQAMTPKEVKKYMAREFQVPAEVLTEQLLKYLIPKTDFKRKSESALKHGLLSGMEILYVGIFNDEPQIWNVNSLRFSFESSPDLQFIEDAESATCEYRMTPSAVIKFFGNELSNSDIDKIYERSGSVLERRYEHYVNPETGIFTFDEEFGEGDTVRVLHCVWKSLRKVGFLTYMDPITGYPQKTVVDDSYKFNEEFDISLEWEWIPEVYETWKIEDIYVRMRPLPGQFKDINNLYDCKLPYYGVVYDNMNSEVTSIMDRLKIYQYFYNIIMYKIELLLATDKGKKILMDIKAIPADSGIDVDKWQYFFESTPFMWYNSSQEGYQDANTLAKVMDMSLISDIDKYINLAEYIRQQAGRSVGINDQMSGEIETRAAVNNVKQGIVMGTNILQPIFELHSCVKRNVLQALIECSKIAYRNYDGKKLSFILDDMSLAVLKMDIGLLDNSTLGVFVANTNKVEETKQVIQQLSMTALQNQKVELSDILEILKSDDINQASEILKIAEDNRRQHEMQIQQQQQQAEAEEAEKQRQFIREQWEHDKEMIVLKEDERRKTEIAKTAMLGASYNPDADRDNDGQNDYVEMATKIAKIDLEKEKLKVSKDKLQHEKSVDEKKLALEKAKIEAMKNRSKA